MKRLLSSGGFSILEIITCVGLAAILITIVALGMADLQKGLNLTDARRQLASDFQLVRMKAISQHTPYRLTFGTLPAASYTVEKYDGAAFVAETGSISFPSGITVTAVNPSASEFQSGGNANVASTVTLSNGSATKAVEVSLIGRIRLP